MDEKNKNLLELAKKDMEVSEEIGGLRSQITEIENTMNQLKQFPFGNISGQSAPNNQIIQQSQQATSQLQQQIQNFRNQTQQQKQQADQQLRQAIQNAMNALSQANQQIQAHQVLEQMSSLIDQTQTQLHQMTQQSQNMISGQQQGQPSGQSQQNMLGQSH
ncbi:MULTISPECIES: hypothetical protein [unclassified Dehalobacter]|uniref:hypothetical protein n=1 Tax=unclassified Dehalobacter TaxID=2635733 RepID=UPI000367355D|nr:MULTISPECIES: hypothetical protein [unclassified Dehalobacter]RJE48986.1 hypothetical protein A7K50_07680 [Dehalobacter sp. MCB1]TCX51725.1 hypothetical protein C1I36_05185 [Dehalobacter sp. 14DCB1]TCX52785.1 hypothetical protein C1I38_06865 [Dehalobacter sp. 12DCB1]